MKVPCLWEEIMARIFTADTDFLTVNLNAETSPVSSPVSPQLTSGTGAAVSPGVPRHCGHSILQQLCPAAKRAEQGKPQASQV